jgi:D-alanine-D-alanine ligase-like ATP-grasp enzyme
MQDPKIILTIGWDSNICLGVAYCLHKAGFKVYLLSHNPNNAGRHSRFVSKVFSYTNEHELTDAVLNIVKNEKIDLVMPYDEIETRTVRENQELISTYAQCSWATAVEQFDIGINKSVLASFLEMKGIPNPPSALPLDQEKINRIIDDFGFPLLAKKTRSSAGRGIQKIFSIHELTNFFTEHNPNNYLLQPFLIGSDITCNVICNQGEIICHTLQESPVKSGEEYNANDTLIYHADEEVLLIVGSMMKALNWHGVACVDLRRDVDTGKPYILEINGRFWGSVLPSFIKAGVNFPAILANLSLGIPTAIPSPKPARQYSLNVYFKRLVKGKWTSLHETKYMPYFQDPIARFRQVFIKS